MSGTFGDDAGDDKLEFPDASVDPLAQSLEKAGFAPEPTEPPPVYRKMPDSRIPVSSKRGSLWKSRRDIGKKQMGDLCDAWDEAIRYYNHDQSDHRDGTDLTTSGNRNVARRLNERHSSTENIVFSNINGQLPSLYSKNPIVTFTSATTPDDQMSDEDEKFARAVGKLINTLFRMRASPGINLKPLAKKSVVIALLTNRAWLEVGYTLKDKSSEQAMSNLLDLSKQLEEAKDARTISKIEGKLQALENAIEFMQPSGPFVRIRNASQVIVDGDHNDPYLTDANWLMIEDMLPTSYINAVFGVEEPDTEEVMSVFEPTHVLSSGGDAEDLDNFTLFDTAKSYSAYGFDTDDAYNKAKRTRIWYVWDKTTRRLEMYSDKDWKWPIWVWDDPFQLQNFFPLVPLWFHENPAAVYAKGEVSYYLDQQDQINEINDEKRRSLLWARRNIFYDKTSGITQDTVDAILKGNDATAVGIDVPEGKDPNKLIFSIPPPSTQFMQMFEKQDLYQAVDRIVATNEVERGGQFKTNTTNKAIDYYSTLGNMRMDLRLDAIEDFIGEIGWKLAQLCLRFMDAQTVQQIIGLDVSSFWKPLDSLGDYSKWAMSCVGGSTQKLSGQAKKQEAVQVGQVLSQYVKAAPASVLKVTLKMFSEAFDDMMISKEDWAAIDDEVERTLIAGQGGAPGQQPGASAHAGVPSPQQGAPGSAPGGDVGDMAQQVVAMLSQLPPQLLKGIGMALAQGATPQQILEHLAQQAQGGASAPPPPGTPLQ